MALTLKVENETTLPDGGPLSVTIRGKRGIDIGRDSHLDWTLPDPTRFISGKHCEIRYKDDSYWLFDVSTNGTFLNGDDHRMQAPHQLRDGDRFIIGNYIVAAVVEEDGFAAVPSQNAAVSIAARPAHDIELWDNEGVVAPPINSKQLRTIEAKRPLQSDFLDWAADIPDPDQGPAPSRLRTRPQDPSADADMDWASGPPSPPPPPPPAPAPMPTPRRQVRERTAETPWDEAFPILEPSAPSAERASAAKAPSASSAGRALPLLADEELADFLRQLAKSSGLPEDFFAQKASGEFAQQLGEVLRLVVENLMQLLTARAQAKRMARSPIHTMVQATDNNPLKFAPSAPEALRIMFAPQNQSYLDAQRAIAQGFEDLKKHQIKTYSAMQHAVTMLMTDLGPEAIERDTADDGGFTRLLSSRKAKLWEAYTMRWHAKIRQGDIGPVEAFMLYFAKYYERDGA